MGAYELAFVGLAGSGVGTLLGLPMVWPFSFDRFRREMNAPELDAFDRR